MSPRRVALYSRVSTDEQDPEVQLRQLREYVARREWSAEEFIDRGVSGSKDSRPELDRLWADVRRRRFSVVVVWKFDRFARSLRQLVLALEEFRSLEVEFVSLTEAIDTSTPLGRAMFGMVGVFAEFEREMIRERVRAGVAKARAEGKRLGRPPVALELVGARARVLGGESVRAVASSLGVHHKTLARALRRADPA